MSLVDIPSVPPAILEQREAQSPQITDVDLLDTEIIASSSSPPRQRRRIAEDGRSVPADQEVIFVHDSEDDEIQYVGSSRSRSAWRERIFSPPPPPQASNIPPVPPIPRRFASMRQSHPLLPPAGLIIPNEQPLPFEADMRQPHENGQRQDAPAAAPPSSHTPSMGFGGALLAGVRHVLNPRGHDTREPWRHRGIWESTPTIMRWDPLNAFAEDVYFGNDADDTEDYPRTGEIRDSLERVFARRNHRRVAEPDYKSEYTHPSKPSPGFTYDFATTPAPSPVDSIIILDDSHSPEPSNADDSRHADPALACAHCHDPLFLGASDVGDDRDQRRLWGLRCGHLLDGKCIKKLMKPVSEAGPELVDASIDVKGKRKMDPETPSMPSSSQENSGKIAVESTNSIRSRLRSRNSVSDPSLDSQHLSFQSDSSFQRPGVRGKAHAGRRGKGKGKAKATGPTVSASYEWTCPVGGCGHIHVSVLVGGQWIMDEKKGAIAVFV
ncbi:hypothetical protein F5J12DRAFT_764165 [Pisolithus orientalis]|uniref:uncharacterized protein n=1 Tax=Pisolithus orientalis TaxID=936130 RepID=UPI002224A6F2|nr:uncharacterized protein F5J12DRAFT_764165 [Pisolithus orientalis]KAI6025681.1 hypothetical protein F5J12DRAFT_764165 [Pisolithus orientalis]